jgi:NAD-dependent deacetylase
MKPGASEVIRLADYSSVLFFIGAGMSAESGVPTYRGAGGIWGQYRYQDVACQRAFDTQPESVLDFHEVRRKAVLACAPHAGHHALAKLQLAHPRLQVVTQNIDGMLQRAGVRVDAELHGSLWRMRCTTHGIREDAGAGRFQARRCPGCDAWLRPDITWFEDAVNESVFAKTAEMIATTELFVSVGTSAAVYPAASFIPLARRAGARMIEINPEPTEASALFERCHALPASEALTALFI